MKNCSVDTKRILVVEDEPSICDICQRVLATEGCEVDVAVNGKIALDMIEQKQYDFCLVDVRTPEMDGKELYQWLKEKHPQLASRIIFTTGSVLGEDVTSFIGQTGRPFLPKPFTPAELKAIVMETLKEVEND
jgi:DNA-binding response OmpR family regulator